MYYRFSIHYGTHL